MDTNQRTHELYAWRKGIIHQKMLVDEMIGDMWYRVKARFTEEQIQKKATRYRVKLTCIDYILRERSRTS
jgi:hypothetical protein